jgi:molybdenum cofactor cytidylyltransferase
MYDPSPRNMHNTGAILLAAGRSSRLGSIKQLLPFHNKTLLQHTIDELKLAGVKPLIVVTGGHAKEVTASINQDGVDLIYNEQWEQGIASGIVAGLQAMNSRYKEIRQVIFAVCDQPYVSAALFEQLYAVQNSSSKNIVASAYADTLGTPVLFTQKYFDLLLSLKGDEGAKKILKAFPEEVARVDFPLGSIDIDTVEDYAGLIAPLKT